MLVSGEGSTLQALLDAAAEPSYGAVVVAVGADREGIRGLERARAVGLPTFVVRLADHPGRAVWDAALADAVSAHEPDLVVLAGFMKILGSGFLSRFAGRIVNTHPALLPAFSGAHAVADALAYGVQVTGATAHLVDAGVDSGPVLAQVAVPVEPDDDESTLHARIKAVEQPMVVAVIGRLAREGFTVTGRKVTIG